MAKFILKRVIYAFMTIFFLIAITFLMMQLLPGDPFTGDKAISDVTMAALEAKYGLDKPLYEQFYLYVTNAMKGDLGISIKYNRPVTTVIADAFPYSFELGMRSLVISIVFGIILGTFAAIKRNTNWDTGSMAFALIGVSVPSFIMGALLQYFLSIKLRAWFGIDFFPVMGWDSEASKIIPAFALSFGSMATVARLMRTSMLDVMGSDYIKTAKAKGLSGFQIVRKHALRNAIMPVVTVLGPIAASVLTGAFVVENIFNIPGMGKFFVLAITENDYTLIAGTTVFYGAFLIVAMLLVDILYCVIDPRVKLGKQED
ncbi:MAG: ABC transporter permease [Lachnospiraceae bacterium]